MAAAARRREKGVLSPSVSAKPAHYFCLSTGCEGMGMGELRALTTEGCDAGWEGAGNAAAPRRSPGWRPAQAPPSRPAHHPWPHRSPLPGEDCPGMALLGAHPPCSRSDRSSRRCRVVCTHWLHNGCTVCRPVLKASADQGLRKPCSGQASLLDVLPISRAGCGRERRLRVLDFLRRSTSTVKPARAASPPPDVEKGTHM